METAFRLWSIDRTYDAGRKRLKRRSRSFLLLLCIGTACVRASRPHFCMSDRVFVWVRDTRGPLSVTLLDTCKPLHSVVTENFLLSFSPSIKFCALSHEVSHGLSSWICHAEKSGKWHPNQCCEVHFGLIGGNSSNLGACETFKRCHLAALRIQWDILLQFSWAKLLQTQWKPAS